MADSFRVLVTALTHRAINNALNKIHELDPALLLCKVGQEGAARDLLPSNFRNFAEADFAHSEGGYIVGATPFATHAGQRLVMTYVGQVPEVLKSTSTLERFIR